jgi:predicted thioesterase
MTEQLQAGRTLTIERRVTPELTAERYGNPGVAVFATPALVALIEETAIRCVAPTLEAGQGTVGTRVDIQHMAATPVGMSVTARVELTAVEGRRLVFAVDVRDEREPIAAGAHERFIVGSMERFLARAAAKTADA